ncbi:MAG: flagellar M-ring protein FliF [Gammaproteobacteria bacterium]|nr:MAG: flagellar M-ring protein FliF [Gammaproteobacteria bacterium]
MAELSDFDSEILDEPPANALVAGFNSLSVIRQFGLMIGLAASIAIGFSVVLWSQEPNYRPLFSNLSDLDVVEITAVLDQNKIPYKIDFKSGLLLVPATDVHTARLQMASEGYSAEQSVGYEMLQKDPSFGTSQFMETARYHRSIEGELARTISAMKAVKSARVHLALPKRSVFVGDKRKPSASIFLEVVPGRSLDKINVAAIVHLVAASIPDLSSKDVTVVDQQGRLLSENDGDSDILMASKQFEYSRSIEKHYNNQISNILLPILGEDNFAVQISAEVDFTKSEQTSESYNPDLPALRSEKILDEERNGGGVLGGVPGALTNQPPAAGNAPQAGAGAGGAAGENNQESNRRSQATRNYELDRTLSHTKRQAAKLVRLSVAVAVDHKLVSGVAASVPATPAATEDGEEAAEGEEVVAVTPVAQTQTQRVALSNEELARLTLLVKNTIGFDAARGDSVEIISQKFLRDEVVPVVPAEPELWQQPWFWEAAKQGGAGLIILILVFGVLRPFMNNLSASGADAQQVSDLADPDGIYHDELTDDELDEESVTLSAGVESLLPGPDENFEQQVDAVRSMIADDPGRVAQVIKTWLADG